MKKTHVAVLMGGVSSEHEVSLKSGAMVAGSLDRERFEITPVVITREGQWKFPGEQLRDVFHAIPLLLTRNGDCVFIALHGPYGEDGRLQGLFDYLKIPYTGPGCAASALAMDKIHSKAVVRQAGVTVAKDLVLHRSDWDADAGTVLKRVESEIGFPCLIKSPCQGSSIGMAIPRDPADFRKSLLNVLAFDDRVLVERFVKGPEITCAVLDVELGKPPRALPLTEICPVDSTFFDYHAKYTPGACKEITPARISPEATERAQQMAVCVHSVIGCSGLSRSDMIMNGDQPVWIEVNTIPGMTETSLFPQAAAAAGISFSALNTMLVENALARNAAGG